MLFNAFAGISIFAALLMMYVAARILGKFGWILSWLRGMAGLFFIAIALMLVLTGLDLFSYKQLLSEKPILTISFKQKEGQYYESTLLFIEDSHEEVYDIHGEQWQIDARIIRWSGVFELFGAKPGYRLDRLSGRYYSLEDERSKPRTVHQLRESEYGFDFWTWLTSNGKYVPLIEAQYGSATYLPIADGAIYQVSLSNSGLVAEPLNDIAQSAISHWQ